MRTLPLLALVACFDGPMTTRQVLEALDQTHRSGLGLVAVEEPIEVSTDFTLGAAIEAAAQEIADFWASQAPCSTVLIEGATLTVDYGDGEDTCQYNGMSWSGVTAVTVASTQPGDLTVTHDWDAFRNENVQVDGVATVDWSGEDATRHVQTEHTWTDTSTGETVDVVDDHVQGPLDSAGGWIGGLTLDGTRDWTSGEDAWALDMTDIAWRWIDPAPEAGQFTISNPEGQVLTVDYARVDATTIAMTITGARRDLVFHIGALGAIEEVTE